MQVSEKTNYFLRNLENFSLFASCTEVLFFPSTKRLWNNLSIDVRTTLSLSMFKKLLLTCFSFPQKVLFMKLLLIGIHLLFIPGCI